MRIVFRSGEVYVLKVITLAVAFACATLILLFSVNEFGYDRFHAEAQRVFRVLQRNGSEVFSGNRLSNRIPEEVLGVLASGAQDSILVSRVKVMDGVDIRGTMVVRGEKVHAADTSITRIFSFSVVDGSMEVFRAKERTLLLSAGAALRYFGTEHAANRKLTVTAVDDTLSFTVAAVFEDLPRNSHENFQVFIRYDPAVLKALNFEPGNTGIYGRVLAGDRLRHEAVLNRRVSRDSITYALQPLPEIYFGPRVTGEDARHGDAYSIYILICITVLILFLALTSFVNLTTLTLPYRSKELAVKKLAGTSETGLLLSFARESFVVSGLSLILGILLLIVTSRWVEPVLQIRMLPFLRSQGFVLGGTWCVLLFFAAACPLLVARRFTGATPVRLLSTETITFPQFKQVITSLQLGISIFLIVASMVMKRQINYSLLKEPGRNYDQVVYLPYPYGLTNEGLRSQREAWKKYHPNIVDVIATSGLPHQLQSKELRSPFYFMDVDPAFAEFFGLQLKEGRWFKANDGDSLFLVNEKGRTLPQGNTENVIGVIKDIRGQFNQPEKPLKIRLAPYLHYNFLCIRILEVDIRRTVGYLSNHFARGSVRAKVTFLDRGFEAWIGYQDRLNALSDALAIISGLLSCCAIYGLSVSIVRDKLKQIAIRKVFGASVLHITTLLVSAFGRPLLIAIAVSGPLTYIIIQELLRNFVYHTRFVWSDLVVPLGYCGGVIILLCGVQAWGLKAGSLMRKLR